EKKVDNSVTNQKEILVSGATRDTLENGQDFIRDPNRSTSLCVNHAPHCLCFGKYALIPDGNKSHKTFKTRTMMLANPCCSANRVVDKGCIAIIDLMAENYPSIVF